jgi:hypothetical protein
MSNVDKAWLEMDGATNLMIINGVLLFEDTIDFEELKDILAERFVAKYERFRQRIVVGSGGRLYWEDDPHFDIRAHVRRYALPEPGDISTLQTVVSAIVNEPLDRRKPLWRYMLIENVEGGCAVLARLHHCIGDGIALIKVLLNMTGATPGESLQVLHLPSQRFRVGDREVLAPEHLEIGVVVAIESELRNREDLAAGRENLIGDVAIEPVDDRHDGDDRADRHHIAEDRQDGPEPVRP